MSGGALDKEFTQSGEMAFFDETKPLLAGRVTKLARGDGFRIAKRTGLLEQTVLLSRNLSNFF